MHILTVGMFFVHFSRINLYICHYYLVIFVQRLRFKVELYIEVLISKLFFVQIKNFALESTPCWPNEFEWDEKKRIYLHFCT